MESDPPTPASRRVEAYLDQILVPLARRLSTFHRAELRRELREHLWARIDAYGELGQPEDEAVTEALHQFGGAEDFLRQWRREWMKTTPRVTLREVWEAGTQALRPSLAGLAATMVPYLVLECPYGPHGTVAGALLQPLGTALFWAITGFAFLLMPAFVGAKQAHRAPQNAGVGMLAALTAEVIVTSLVYRIVAWHSPDPNVQSLFTILVTLMAAWVPIAGGAAAVSSWWERRSVARRLA